MRTLTRTTALCPVSSSEGGASHEGIPDLVSLRMSELGNTTTARHLTTNDITMTLTATSLTVNLNYYLPVVVRTRVTKTLATMSTTTMTTILTLTAIV